MKRRSFLAGLLSLPVAPKVLSSVKLETKVLPPPKWCQSQYDERTLCLAKSMYETKKQITAKVYNKAIDKGQIV